MEQFQARNIWNGLSSNKKRNYLDAMSDTVSEDTDCFDGTPKPFDTYGSGIGSTINVKKKACWPEVMTVHKIECESSGYKLHVSREYFEHDRIWYEFADYGSDPDLPRSMPPACVRSCP